MTARVADRLVRGWDDGFDGTTRAALGAAAVAYRGLIGTRGWLYAHRLLRPRAVGCPVVSIGNLTVGGTGKTPAVELAVRTLADLGLRPAVVSRGYGRKSRGVQVVADTASIRVEPDEAGDEPFLLARRLPGVPVVVGADRWDAARTAIESFGATAIVLDDGFQQRTLLTTVDIVMARAERPWGNGRVLPAGPLREPLSALGRAHLVVAVGVGAPDEVATALGRHARRASMARAMLEPTECWDARRMEPVPLARLRGARLLAFAGIAAPASFGVTLEALGVRAEVVPFVDHHWYSRDDLARLARRAAGADGLVTTEKDWVRLRGRLAGGPPVYVVGVALRLVAGADEWRRVLGRCRPA